jgi:NhaC family Na+:H+ antiporter
MKPSPGVSTQPQPSFAISVLPVIMLVALLAVAIGRMDGSGHVPLILTTAFAAALASWKIGVSWPQIEAGIRQGIDAGMQAIVILLVVGLLIGVWIASGVVPLLIYYGLLILAPSYFLVASCLICAVVSLATGSSWSTAATVGLALIGVGSALGMDPGMTAGAVVSGAYFGDKMSPLSDTTNLAPATAGSELFEHIRHMVYTTLPALVIALIAYTALGLGIETSANATSANYDQLVSTLKNTFTLSPLLLIAPATVLALVIRKVPALPALMAGVLAGVLLLLTVQGGSVELALNSLYGGYASDTGVGAVDELLSRGGLTSMLDTIALIICALTFGGVMEASGMLATLARGILSLVRSTGSLIAATLVSCIGMNILTSDQYISIVIPGRMYRSAYRRRGLHAKNLSRALEDSATMTSPLVPWNTCGAYMAGVLGVATGAYLPYAFLNLTVPVISLILGLTGWTIEPLARDDSDG